MTNTYNLPACSAPDDLHKNLWPEGLIFPSLENRSGSTNIIISSILSTSFPLMPGHVAKGQYNPVDTNECSTWTAKRNYPQELSWTRSSTPSRHKWGDRAWQLAELADTTTAQVPVLTFGSQFHSLLAKPCRNFRPVLKNQSGIPCSYFCNSATLFDDNSKLIPPCCSHCWFQPRKIRFGL